MPPDGEVVAAGAAFRVTAGRRMTVVLERVGLMDGDRRHRGPGPGRGE